MKSQFPSYFKGSSFQLDLYTKPPLFKKYPKKHLRGFPSLLSFRSIFALKRLDGGFFGATDN
jgi:hypothetical protein